MKPSLATRNQRSWAAKKARRLTKISNAGRISLNQIGDAEKSLDLRDQSDWQFLTIKGLGDMITPQSERSREGAWIVCSVTSSTSAGAGLVSVIVNGVCNNNFWHFFEGNIGEWRLHGEEKCIYIWCGILSVYACFDFLFVFCFMGCDLFRFCFAQFRKLLCVWERERLETKIWDELVFEQGR